MTFYCSVALLRETSILEVPRNIIWENTEGSNFSSTRGLYMFLYYIVHLCV